MLQNGTTSPLKKVSEANTKCFTKQRLKQKKKRNARTTCRSRGEKQIVGGSDETVEGDKKNQRSQKNDQPIDPCLEINKRGRDLKTTERTKEEKVHRTQWIGGNEDDANKISKKGAPRRKISQKG